MNVFGLEFLTTKEVAKLREDASAIADLERALEDIGWTNINSPNTGLFVEAKEAYVRMVKRSRLAFVKNPIVSQGVELTTFYVFGDGVSAPKSQDEDVQKVLTDFWKDPDNRLALTSPINQFKLSNKLQYDGELVFVLQPDVDGRVYVRIIDPISINGVVFDNVDGMRPIFYRRSRPMGSTEYFADITNAAVLMKEEYPEAYDALLKDHGINPKEVINGAYIYHVKINNDILDRRGIPTVYRAIDWGNSNNKMNNDLSSFINAQAQYAIKKKVKGTRGQIDAMAAKIRQNTTLTNPSTQAGATLLQNQLIDTEMVGLPSSTGQLFETGIRRSLLMMCAAFGIMEHYFGDPSTGNLATATAMELPMLKRFQAFRKIWEGIFDDILNFQLDMALWATNSDALELNVIKNRYEISNDYSDRGFNVDFPPILQQDLMNLATALTSAKSGQLIPTETAQRLFMAAAGVTNIDEEMEKEFAQPAPKFMIGPDGKPVASNPEINMDDPKAEEASIEETIRLLEMIKKEGSGFAVYSEDGSKRLGGPYKTKAQAMKRLRQVEMFKKMKEAARVPSGVTDGRAKALKLADKNKKVLGQIRSYVKEIGASYKQFAGRAQRAAKVSSVIRESRTMYKLSMSSVKPATEALGAQMKRLGKQYIPKAVATGVRYVKSHGKLLKEAAKDFNQDDFSNEQIDQNNGYIDDSLVPALNDNFDSLDGTEYASEEAANAAVSDAVASFETRVGSYASALWTASEAAVQASADPTTMVNFVGADDGNTCEGCGSAMDGNPWPIDEAPQPGDQDCLGNCRHALQIEGDEALTEDDKTVLKTAQDAAKKGFTLL